RDGRRRLVPAADRRAPRARRRRGAHRAPRRDPCSDGPAMSAPLRPFPAAAREALADRQLRSNLANATSSIREKRNRVVAELPDWEELRDAGRAIKADLLANLEG